jgi:hypothetical protein
VLQSLEVLGMAFVIFMNILVEHLVLQGLDAKLQPTFGVLLVLCYLVVNILEFLFLVRGIRNWLIIPNVFEFSSQIII